MSKSRKSGEKTSGKKPTKEKTFSELKKVAENKNSLEERTQKSKGLNDKKKNEGLIVEDRTGSQKETSKQGQTSQNKKEERDPKKDEKKDANSKKGKNKESNSKNVRQEDADKKTESSTSKTKKKKNKEQRDNASIGDLPIEDIIPMHEMLEKTMETEKRRVMEIIQKQRSKDGTKSEDINCNKEKAVAIKQSLRHYRKSITNDKHSEHENTRENNQGTKQGKKPKQNVSKRKQSKEKIEKQQTQSRIEEKEQTQRRIEEKEQTQRRIEEKEQTHRRIEEKEQTQSRTENKRQTISIIVDQFLLLCQIINTLKKLLKSHDECYTTLCDLKEKINYQMKLADELMSNMFQKQQESIPFDMNGEKNGLVADEELYKRAEEFSLFNKVSLMRAAQGMDNTGTKEALDRLSKRLTVDNAASSEAQAPPSSEVAMPDLGFRRILRSSTTVQQKASSAQIPQQEASRPASVRSYRNRNSYHTNIHGETNFPLHPHVDISAVPVTQNPPNKTQNTQEQQREQLPPPPSFTPALNLTVSPKSRQQQCHPQRPSNARDPRTHAPQASTSIPSTSRQQEPELPRPAPSFCDPNPDPKQLAHLNSMQITARIREEHEQKRKLQEEKWKQRQIEQRSLKEKMLMERQQERQVQQTEAQERVVAKKCLQRRSSMPQPADQATQMRLEMEKIVMERQKMIEQQGQNLWFTNRMTRIHHEDNTRSAINEQIRLQNEQMLKQQEEILKHQQIQQQNEQLQKQRQQQEQQKQQQQERQRTMEQEGQDLWISRRMERIHQQDNTQLSITEQIELRLQNEQMLKQQEILKQQQIQQQTEQIQKQRQEQQKQQQQQADAAQESVLTKILHLPRRSSVSQAAEELQQIIEQQGQNLWIPASVENIQHDGNRPAIENVQVPVPVSTHAAQQRPTVEIQNIVQLRPPTHIPIPSIPVQHRPADFMACPQIRPTLFSQRMAQHQQTQHQHPSRHSQTSNYKRHHPYQQAGTTSYNTNPYGTMMASNSQHPYMYHPQAYYQQPHSTVQYPQYQQQQQNQYFTAKRGRRHCQVKGPT